MVTLDGISGLGTGWWFELFDASEAQRPALHTSLQSYITHFDAAYSRFRDDSLIGRLNREGVLHYPPAELVALLQFGLALYRDSQGTFNLLTAAVQEAHGYDAHHSFACTDTPDIPDPTKSLVVTTDRIELAAGQIDLGGYGKGWLIDALASHIRNEFGLQYFLINGGGDIFVTSDHGQSVSVALAHPSNSHLMLGEVSLQNQALGVSNTYMRRWHDRHTKRPVSHIVDTRQPDALFDTAAFVIAPRAVEADAWATIGCVEPSLFKTQASIEYLALHDLRPVATSERFAQVVAATLGS